MTWQANERTPAVKGLLILSGLVIHSALAAAPSGAIFTTTANGSRVNENIYTSKCEVYLDGGPGANAPAKAAGLADGEYYFQVTDPSGKVLLSTDPVSNRRFEVSGGVIVAYTGTGGPVHPLGYDRDHPELGAITIRLAHGECPGDFLDSPNGGGEYKAWATPVGDFTGDPSKVDNDCGNGCFHGFVPSKSKTDSFKAQVGTPTLCLSVWKRLVTEDGEIPGAGWKISIVDPVGVDNAYYAGQDGFLRVCGLVRGTYVVTEDTPDGYTVADLLVNGVQQQYAQPVYPFFWEPGRPEPVIVFKNRDQGAPQPY